MYLEYFPCKKINPPSYDFALDLPGLIDLRDASLCPRPFRRTGEGAESKHRKKTHPFAEIQKRPVSPELGSGPVTDSQCECSF